MEVKLILEGEITIVSLSGRIDIEKTQAFKQACLSTLSQKKVVFCLKNLHFVGSTGIQSFFSVLNELNDKNLLNAKVASLNPDFQRLFSFSGFQNLEAHESIENAMLSWA